MEKVLAKIFYTNINEDTLKRIEKGGARFEQPPAFKHRPEGIRLYLTVGNDKKYYEV